MKHTKVKLLHNASEGYPAMLRAINAAKQRVWLANYWQSDDVAYPPFHRALLAAARRGCEVRLLIDNHGSKAPNKTQTAALTAAGVQITRFNPVSKLKPWRYNKRLHKKILIIDNTVGFTGGLGIREAWYRASEGYPKPWRDTHFALTGQAIRLLEQGFISSWNLYAEHPIWPTNPKADREIQLLDSQPNLSGGKVAELLCDLIDNTKQHINLTTPYFSPTKELHNALVQASLRGVQVDIICNGPYSTHPIAQRAGRAQYKSLIAAGVYIYEYQPTKIHTKAYTFDGLVSVIGSANINSRSARHDEELSLIIRDKDLAKQLDDDFAQDSKSSKLIGKLTLQQKIVANSAGLLRWFF